MGHQSVTYRKQLEIRGSLTAAVSIDEAVAKVKSMATISSDRKYKNGRTRRSKDHTVEICAHLGIDPRQADQMIRGAISLPKGIGKARRVVAFCDGAQIDTAKAAGAVDAGADELIAKVQGGWFDFDVAIAHPSLMGKVGKLGKVLGPQGKMPSPKAGTVTPDVPTAVKEFTAGRLEFRNDGGGNVHLPVGKTSFTDADLKSNIAAVIEHLHKVKPQTAKGHFFKRVCISAARTPSVTIAVAS